MEGIIMSNVVSRYDVSKLFDDMMLQMDVLEQTMSNSMKIEREEMEEVMKDQIQRLHITLDEVEKVMKEQKNHKLEPKPAIPFSQRAYSVSV
jgi:alpha-galactosidase/6-phospho-beta-glucosidase family protein